VSHRMLSIKWVDRILLLDAGVIKAAGTHHELFQNEERYQLLFNYHSNDSAGPAFPLSISSQVPCQASLAGPSRLKDRMVT
jgi:hypothetical protein